jgi:hypothetical protein
MVVFGTGGLSRYPNDNDTAVYRWADVEPISVRHRDGCRYCPHADKSDRSAGTSPQSVVIHRHGVRLDNIAYWRDDGQKPYDRCQCRLLRAMGCRETIGNPERPHWVDGKFSGRATVVSVCSLMLST